MQLKNKPKKDDKVFLFQLQVIAQAKEVEFFHMGSDDTALLLFNSLSQKYPFVQYGVYEYVESTKRMEIFVEDWSFNFGKKRKKDL